MWEYTVRESCDLDLPSWDLDMNLPGGLQHGSLQEFKVWEYTVRESVYLDLPILDLDPHFPGSLQHGNL